MPRTPASPRITGWLFVHTPRGFLPTEDTGRIVIRTEGLQGSSIRDMIAHQMPAAEIVRNDPAVDHSMSTVGGGGGTDFTHEGQLVLKLKDRDKRLLWKLS